jgi:hypothetical protein
MDYITEIKETSKSMKGSDILKNIENEIARKYPNISRWMEAMNLIPEYKMVRHSFIREFVFKNFNISKFCKEFDGFLGTNDDKIKDKPLKLFKEFIIKNFVEKKKLLNGKPLKKTGLPEKVSHYLSVDKFYYSIIKGGDVARGPQERLNLKEEWVFRLMIENKLTPDDMAYWKGELKGASDITWFTKYDSIPQEFRECSDDKEAAKKIRDLLGLAHIFNCGLIEVQIPKEIVENGSRLPTICEAAGNSYFRPAKRTDGFGRAIDLDKRTTGLPEAVHDKIGWNGNFKPRYVGDLRGEKVGFSDDLEWQQVTTESENDLIAFIKGVNNEA